MDKDEKIFVETLNPFVRFFQKLENSERLNHIVPWRILYDYEIIFVVKGALEIYLEDKMYIVSENCMHIMPPFVKHTQMVPEGVSTTYYSMHLDFSYLPDAVDFDAQQVYQVPCEKKLRESVIDEKLIGREVANPAYITPVECYKFKKPLLILNLFEKLATHYEKKDLSDKLIVKACAIEIIAKLLADIKEEEQYNKRGGGYIDIISNFIEYADNHYLENIDLDSLIADYGISSSYFRLLFKRKMKNSPSNYLISLRMEQAKKLLATGKYNVSEVSYMVGYNDVYYFSRLFKKKIGVSPKQFSKNSAEIVDR